MGCTSWVFPECQSQVMGIIKEIMVGSVKNAIRAFINMGLANLVLCWVDQPVFERILIPENAIGAGCMSPDKLRLAIGCCFQSTQLSIILELRIIRKFIESMMVDNPHLISIRFDTQNCVCNQIEKQEPKSGL